MNPNFYRQNTFFALIMGGCFILSSFIAYKISGSIYANNVLNKTILFLYITGLFIQIRKYRESCLNGYMSYGQALGTGCWISLVCSFIYGIFVTILYESNPDLMTDYFNILENTFREVYSDSAFVDQVLGILRTFLTPLILGFSALFEIFFNGFIYSLIIGLFLKKKENFNL